MQSLISFVDTIVNYWTYIVFFVMVGFTVLKKVQSFLKLSDIDKKNAIMQIVDEEILKLMSDAEINWSEFESAGKIKRSEVINQIYSKYPELSKFKDQEEIIKEIDKMIDDAKKDMDKIFEESCKEETTEDIVLESI